MNTENFIKEFKIYCETVEDTEGLEIIKQYYFDNMLNLETFIDDYIDIKTLQLLKCAKDNIEIIIFSDNKARNSINTNFINDFINDTGFNIQFKKNNNRFHDRYIIIDFDTENEIIFHCGASSKDAGKRITTITKIEEQYIYKELVKDILNNENIVL